ncbi:hypothetical protein [Vitiosangium sp. GDMCC 1.1324]|uniref:hypothetical protein n=1 Tax=Vitiosangium sp. (strain GDMCC 1.1324) TaxID=2138576 RepID=UPI0011B431DB|nr:hypothetical protein [Vitiosangium sp. GDMCC 1.1324]
MRHKQFRLAIGGVLGFLLVAIWAGYSWKTEQGVGQRTPTENMPEPVRATQHEAHGATPSGELSSLVGQHETYQVHATGATFTVTPIRPRQQSLTTPELVIEREEGAPATFETIAMERGGNPLALTAGRGRATTDGDWVIERGSVVEQVRQMERGVEQSWNFDRKPAGRGGLVVHIRVTGQKYTESSRYGLHFASEGKKTGLLYSRATWVDARGRRTPIMPRYEGGEIRLAISNEVLESSEYPAVLDPIISSDFKMENSVYPAISGAQTNPAVAFDHVNKHYLVVWTNQRPTTGADIYGALLNTDGTLFKGGVVISSASGDQRNPSVAFDGSNFLVVWEDERNPASTDIYGARVDGNGAVLDTSGIVLTSATNNQTLPKVVFRGSDSDYLVVWQDTRNVNRDIYGTRVNVAGNVLDGSGVALIMRPGEQGQPAIAVGATNSFLVWEDGSGSATSHIYGALLPAGSLTSLSAFNICPGPTASQITPSVTFHVASGNYFVVWSDTRNTTTSNDIYGTRVNSAGTVLDASGFAISNAPLEQFAPSIATAGDSLVAVWQDARNSIDNDIFGNRLLGSGGVLDGSGFSISSSTDEQTPVVSPAVTGQQLVLYSAPDPSLSIPRIRGRLISRQPLGNTCSLNQDCASGFCVDGVCCNSACGGNSSDDCLACSTVTGATANGTCTARPNGAACSDGNACTTPDTCQAGVCTAGTPATCPASDQCHDVGTCNPATGTCSNPTKPNGSSCSDGNACTRTDTCQGGTCTGAAPVTCAASDQCHDVGTCNPATGTCSNPAKPNGSSCSDGNACTRTDTCQAGTCTASSPVTCTASDQCHDVGTCNPATGICSNPAKPNGSSCSDGNACTRTDTCQAGTCTAGTPATCTASDQCHDVGTCNPATGTCSNPAKPNGSSCSDGNACTRTDTCQGGTCTGAAPVTCAASDQCHDVGTCNPATGTCSNPAKPNGSSCDDGNTCALADSCQAGVCVAGTVRPPEICNLVDDNCDGAVDNIPALTCSTRECRVGTKYCTARGGTACSYTANSRSGTLCSIGSCNGKGSCCGTVRTYVAARYEYEILFWYRHCSGWLWWRKCTWYPFWGWRYYPAHYVNKYKCI